MDYEKTGRLIRKKRLALGLTQTKLSEAVAVTPQAVSLWEKGKRFPDALSQCLLLKVLKLNPVELLSGIEMFDDELKQGIQAHMTRIDERCFVAGMVSDEYGSEFYLNLSNYDVFVPDKDGTSGKWIPYTDYYNVDPVADREDPFLLPLSPYDPEKLYLNHGHFLLVIPVDILKAMGRPRFFTVCINHEEGILGLQFADDPTDDGFDIPEQVYDSPWKGLRVLGGAFGLSLCKEMGIRFGLDLVEIRPELLTEERAVLLPLDQAKRVNVNLAGSDFLLPQRQNEEMSGEEE